MILLRHGDFIVFLICCGAIVASWMDVLPTWIAAVMIIAAALRKIQKDRRAEAVQKDNAE